MMPWQLARGLKAKRQSRSTEQRPLVETLPRLNIADLCRLNAFPDQCDIHGAYIFEMPFKYPFVKSLLISLQNIEANHHTGYPQRIPLRWIRTGFGGHYRPRPLFICQCGRSVRRLYFRRGNFACRRCHSAIYASQVCGKHSRPVLQAKRLRTFLKLKSYMSKRNRQRFKARLTPKQSHLSTKRLADDAIQRPQGNYRTRGAMHWA
jgi:hypothetical protein